MAVIGKATLNVVPKIQNLTQAVKQELAKADQIATSSGASVGNKYSQSFSGGLVKAGVVGGAFAALTQRAMSAVSGSLDGAISRFDTLNNYPTVMQSLGYSAEDAQGSLDKMNTHLQGLPTSLNDMVSSVQGIAACTGDLTLATDAALGFNDMLLASGASTQLSTAATEQFRQMLAKGKPELQDWKSLTQAMPGQMNQLAEAMLGAGHNANDLYYALGGGKESDAPEGIEWASISMNDMLDTIVRLDSEGGEGFASFSEQAKTATGGVQTSMSNLQTAMERGLSGILESIGKSNISGFFSDLTGVINNAFSAIQGVMTSVMPTVQSFYNVFKSNASTITTGIVAFGGLQTVLSGVASKISAGRTNLQNYKVACAETKTQTTLLGKANSILGTSFSPVSLAITGISVAVSLAVASYQKYKEHAERVSKATSGISDAVSRCSNLSSYAGQISNVGTSASGTSENIDSLLDSVGNHADKMNEIAQSAETNIATLNTAQGIINNYAGQTDLSTEAQGRLKWALDEVNTQFGLSLSTADVAAGKYTDQEGKVQNLKDKVNELIEAKKAEIKQDALKESLSEAYKAEAEAAQAAAKAQKEYNDKKQELLDMGEITKQWMNSDGTMQTSTIAITEDNVDQVMRYYEQCGYLVDNLTETQSALDNTKTSVENLETSLGTNAEVAQGSADAYTSWANQLSEKSQYVAQEYGTSTTEIAGKLRELGYSQEDISQITDQKFEEMVQAYDGTTSSVVAKMDEWGIANDNAAASVGRMKNDIKDSFEEVEGLADVFNDTGISADDFAQKCAEAGLDTQDFADMSAESFQMLAQECGNDTTQMVNSILEYNHTPLVNKDGSVNVECPLLDAATGKIYYWNSEENQLQDKYGNAAVDCTSVVDGTGAVWTYENQSLTNKDANAQVQGNAVNGTGERAVEDTQGAIDSLHDKYPSVDVEGNIWTGGLDKVKELAGWLASIPSRVQSYVETITHTTENAAGGFRLNAAGGYKPRYHASGAIATRAVPLDIVGEDGAEAIVPLTNQKYAQPFIDMLAKGLTERMAAPSTGTDELVAALKSLVAAQQQAAQSASEQYVSSANAIIGALPNIISRNTPVMGKSEFGRQVRKAVSYA